MKMIFITICLWVLGPLPLLANVELFPLKAEDRILLGQIDNQLEWTEISTASLRPFIAFGSCGRNDDMKLKVLGINVLQLARGDISKVGTAAQCRSSGVGFTISDIRLKTQDNVLNQKSFSPCDTPYMQMATRCKRGAVMVKFNIRQRF